MTSRERVLITLSHEEPDKGPKDLEPTNVTGICARAYEGVLQLLGIKEEIEIIDRVQGLAKVSPTVRKELGIDIYGLWPRSSARGVQREGKNQAGEEFFVDEWGFYWRKPVEGLYYDVVDSPLADIDPTNFDLDSFYCGSDRR